LSGGVIAIDGPSASGKSSTARAVAEALGFAHLDSGSLYRGVTLVSLREAARRGLDQTDLLRSLSPETILRAAEDRGLMLQSDGAGFAAYLEGEPVEDALRSVQVTAHVSAIAAIPVVREWVNTRLRAMVRAGQDVVVDGRDIGTVVFPEADLKIFLTASPAGGSASGVPPSTGITSTPRPRHSLPATTPIRLGPQHPCARPTMPSTWIPRQWALRSRSSSSWTGPGRSSPALDLTAFLNAQPIDRPCVVGPRALSSLALDPGAPAGAVVYSHP
jgi:cytidylate kinase